MLPNISRGDPSRGRADKALRAGWKPAEDLVALISKEGGHAIAVQGDVSIEVDAARIVAVTLDRFGRIDCLINTPVPATGSRLRT